MIERIQCSYCDREAVYVNDSTGESMCGLCALVSCWIGENVEMEKVEGQTMFRLKE